MVYVAIVDRTVMGVVAARTFEMALEYARANWGPSVVLHSSSLTHIGGGRSSLSGVQRYRKKPVVIEAIQVTGENNDQLAQFAGEALYIDNKPAAPELRIVTLEGDFIVSRSDWIIRGVKGEFYPCKPDVFETTYEPVEAGN